MCRAHRATVRAREGGGEAGEGARELGGGAGSFSQSVLTGAKGEHTLTPLQRALSHPGGIRPHHPDTSHQTPPPTLGSHSNRRFGGDKYPNSVTASHPDEAVP